MKNLFLFILLAFCSFTLIACQSQNEEMTLLDNVLDNSISESRNHEGKAPESIEVSESEIVNTDSHQKYTGDDSWIHTEAQIASHVNAPFGGEFKQEMSVDTNNYDLRYYFKNRGDISFTWKIYDPEGKVWTSGFLDPGEFGTWEALHDSLQVGVYKISVITSTGGNGALDFSAKVLN